MTFIPAPGVAQMTIKGVWASVIPIANVFHVQRVGANENAAWSASQLSLAADRIRGGYNNFVSNLASAAVFTEVTARDLTSAIAASTSRAITLAGTDAGASTGPYEGPVIRWNTTLGGRHVGRTFLPGIGEAAVDSIGTVLAARVTAMTAAGDAFLAFLGAATDGTHLGEPLFMTVVSNLVNSGTGNRFTFPVLSSTCRPMVGIQRNRRPGQ